MAIGDGDGSGRIGLTLESDSVERNLTHEASFNQRAADHRLIVVAVRQPCQESGRIGREQWHHRLGDAVGEFVVLDAIPDIEQERPARAQHPACLREGFRLVRKEHGTELAHHHIKGVIGKWKAHRIGLLPRHRAAGANALGVVEHGLIQIGSDDGYVGGQLSGKVARDHPRASGDL